MTLIELVEASAQQLTDAEVSFGHGTANAFDEAAWLVLWRLGLPLDTSLESLEDNPDSKANTPVAPAECAEVATLLEARITSRKPAAYLTREAWLQGMAFYVDERAIVPRSLIAELLVDGGLDYWLHENTTKMLDLCTGNGSLAVIAAMVYPEVVVTGSDLSADALEVAAINVKKYALQDRVALVESDGFTSTGLQQRGPFDLILCNPPYVNAQSMSELPPEYRAEPALALAGGTDGMDFIRTLFADAPGHMADDAVLVLEIGNERDHFEAAFPELDVVWLETSAGEDHVLLVTHEALCVFAEARRTG
jgi:ribosomal protein L3 glutamine methyltransferase